MSVFVEYPNLAQYICMTMYLGVVAPVQHSVLALVLCVLQQRHKYYKDVNHRTILRSNSLNGCAGAALSVLRVIK